MSKTQSDSNKQEKDSPPSLQHTSHVMEELSLLLNFTVVFNNTTYCMHLWECFLRMDKKTQQFQLPTCPQASMFHSAVRWARGTSRSISLANILPWTKEPYQHSLVVAVSALCCWKFSKGFSYDIQFAEMGAFSALQNIQLFILLMLTKVSVTLGWSSV